MQTEYTVAAVHQGGTRIQAAVGDFTVPMDYPLSPESAKTAPTPLETLLASLAGCAGNSMVLLLAKMKQPVAGLDVNVRGLRRQEHPTIITEIDLEFVVRGDVDHAAAEKALSLSEQQICPVWAMLKGGTTVRASLRFE
jgi:uncharacterized OsmC-like protein